MSSDEAPPERPEYVVDAWDAPKSKTVQEQKQSDLEKYVRMVVVVQFFLVNCV